jgi:hypothetical protein
MIQHYGTPFSNWIFGTPKRSLPVELRFRPCPTLIRSRNAHDVLRRPAHQSVRSGIFNRVALPAWSGEAGSPLSRDRRRWVVGVVSSEIWEGMCCFPYPLPLARCVCVESGVSLVVCMLNRTKKSSNACQKTRTALCACSSAPTRSNPVFLAFLNLSTLKFCSLNGPPTRAILKPSLFNSPCRAQVRSRAAVEQGGVT